MDGLRFGRSRGRSECRGDGAFRRLARNLALVFTLILACAPSFAAAEDPYFDNPRVVVYPLTTSGDTQKAAGDAIATGLANRLATLGGLAVVPATPNVARPQYLTNAHTQNADYYITGFVTTIGDQVSMIVQLVSTQSGTVVWSRTWLVTTLNDAVGHAPEIHDALLQHAGRNLSAYENPAPAAATPKPEPEESGHIANILGVFHHRSRGAAPSPTASPAKVATTAPPAPVPSRAPTAAPVAQQAATVAAAPPGIALLEVGGDAETTARFHAAKSLADAFARAGANAHFVRIPARLAARRASDACASAPATTTVAAATLHIDEHLRAELSLTTYGCDGRALTLDRARQKAIGRSGFISTIDDLAARVVAAYLRRSPQPRRAGPAGGS